MNIKQLTAAIALAGFFVVAFSMTTVASSTVQAETASPRQTQTQDPPANTVMIQPGDTLSAIATAAQTTYVRLYNANTFIEHPDVIHPGDSLRVPAADEQLAERPLPGSEAVSQPAAVAAPAKPQSQPAAVSAVSASVWDRLAQCESGGNWAINTGNGYYGGLQFTLGTWQGLGGVGYPHQASKAEQIKRAQMLQARSGWGQWPACTAKLGLR